MFIHGCTINEECTSSKMLQKFSSTLPTSARQFRGFKEKSKLVYAHTRTQFLRNFQRRNIQTHFLLKLKVVLDTPTEININCQRRISSM